MLLALDVGNTEVTVGLFHGDTLLGHWRLTTTADRTPDEWTILLDALLARAGQQADAVRAACVASVAPTVTIGLLQGIHALKVPVGVVEPRATLPLVLDVDEPLA